MMPMSVTELFGLTHHVRGEEHGFPLGAAFADEGHDGPRGHDVQTQGGFVKDHHRGIVHQRAGDGDFLLHARGQRVAAAVAEVNLQALEYVVDAPAKHRAAEPVQAAKVFGHFPRGQAAVEGGGSGKIADVRADLLRIAADIVAGDARGAGGGFENGGQHAQSGGLTCAVGSQESVDLAGLAAKGDAVHGAHHAAPGNAEMLAEVFGFNHGAWLPVGIRFFPALRSCQPGPRENILRQAPDQPLWQLGHCLASKFSAATRNILLHWMHTRCSGRLGTRGGSPGRCCSDVF